MHDWVGRRLGIPVWRLLGLDQPRKQTTFTIGVADLAETRVKVEEARAAGYDALKVKVGTKHDDETLSIVREAFVDGPLLLDANQGWEPDEAVEKIPKLGPLSSDAHRAAAAEGAVARDGPVCASCAWPR